MVMILPQVVFGAMSESNGEKACYEFDNFHKISFKVDNLN